MSQEHTQEFQITAANQVGDCECMPEQMRMEPVNAGVSLEVLEEHFHGIGRQLH